ncbi:MAG: cytochrome, partial [Mycobacterium sp.]
MPHRHPVPDPPYAKGTGLPWDVSVADAVAAIAAARARHGDTFAVHSGPDHYLFTFSPTGVESFYGLPEEKASKGVADYLMLRRKLPEDIFEGRRILPGTLFRRDDVAGYLANLDRALAETTAELGSAGSVDVFDLTRRLGHRMGLASWAGPGSAQGEAFERLARAFDTLDGSDAFVHP